MKRSRATWKVAVGHHTMRSVSSHGDTQELLQLLLPVLKDNSIDLYINGHDHCLEHISSRDRSVEFNLSCVFNLWHIFIDVKLNCGTLQ